MLRRVKVPGAAWEKDRRRKCVSVRVLGLVSEYCTAGATVRCAFLALVERLLCLDNGTFCNITTSKPIHYSPLTAAFHTNYILLTTQSLECISLIRRTADEEVRITTFIHKVGLYHCRTSTIWLAGRLGTSHLGQYNHAMPKKEI